MLILDIIKISRSNFFADQKTSFLREAGATMSYGAHTLPKNRADRAEQDGVDENSRLLLKNHVLDEILFGSFREQSKIRFLPVPHQYFAEMCPGFAEAEMGPG